MFDLTMDGAIARVTINRGEKRNAVPVSGWAEFERAIRQANTSDANVVVITSRDADSFCAGSDLFELNELVNDMAMRRKFRGAMASAFSRLQAVNKPTVSLISGGCFGTGVSLAMACDLRIARSDASFAITPARFGFSYPATDVERLVALVGPGQAANLVYTSEMISGAEAKQIGLVERIDDGPDFGAEIINRIAQNGRSSLCTLKATLLKRFGVNQRFDAAFSSQEFRDCIQAFGSRSRARSGGN